MQTSPGMGDTPFERFEYRRICGYVAGCHHNPWLTPLAKDLLPLRGCGLLSLETPT